MTCIENNTNELLLNGKRVRNQDAMVVLNNQNIAQAPLANFAGAYVQLGGIRLNNEAVNMIIRKVDNDMQQRPEILPQSMAFELVCQLILRHGNFRDKELWRLAATYTDYKYAYQPSYLGWQWERLTAPSIFK